MAAAFGLHASLTLSEETLRACREAQYARLQDAVYERRGWTRNGVPTLEKLAALGIDYPEVVAVVRPQLEGEPGSG